MKSPSKYLIIGIVAVVIVLIISNSTFVTLQPGEKGVIFRKFTSGLDKDNVYNEGFQVVAPWNTMHIYNVKEQKVEEQMDVLDKNGLSISVDISSRFYPVPNRIGYLHEKFGQSYIATLVIPEVRSSTRKVMGRFSAEEIFSTKRKEVEDAIFQETRDVLNTSNNNIQLTALLLRSIKLPPQIKQAIENKLQQEQEALAYQFRLDKEKSEAERKRIAAEGEATANKIINSSLTPELLKMREIEATFNLANSQNTKVIIVGDKGVPFILGNN